MHPLTCAQRIPQLFSALVRAIGNSLHLNIVILRQVEEIHVVHTHGIQLRRALVRRAISVVVDLVHLPLRSQIRSLWDTPSVDYARAQKEGKRTNMDRD